MRKLMIPAALVATLACASSAQAKTHRLAVRGPEKARIVDAEARQLHISPLPTARQARSDWSVHSFTSPWAVTGFGGNDSTHLMPVVAVLHWTRRHHWRVKFWYSSIPVGITPKSSGIPAYIFYGLDVDG